MHQASAHRRAWLSALAVVGLFLVGSTSAQAALTAPADGAVYRGDVPFNEDTGGRMVNKLTVADVPGVSSLSTQAKIDASTGYYLSGSGANCLSTSAAAANLANPLRTLPAADKATKTRITVTRNSDNQVVYDQTRDSNQNSDFVSLLTIAFGGDTPNTNPPQPWKPQPYSGTWLTNGQQAGMYTLRSATRDVVRGDPNAAVLPTDSATVKAGKKNNISTCAIRDSVESRTFEYRPWEQRFKDTLQNSGGVDFNLKSSREVQWNLRNGVQSTIKNSPESFTVVKLPTNASIVLPPDPSVCSPNPQACLPPAPDCDSDPTCKDRLVVINYKEDASGQSLLGFFDLQSRMFVAAAKVGNNTAILKSAGLLDPQILALKSQLATEAAKYGISMAQLSAMKVRYISQNKEISLSLDEGLEQVVSTGMDGATIKGGPAVSAGVITHLVTGAYKGTAGGPYKVFGSALTAPPIANAPEIPALPAPLTSYGPLVQGLLQNGGLGLRQVKGKDYQSGQHIYSLALGLEPAIDKLLYLPGDAATVSDKSIDFVGVPLAIAQTGACNTSGDCVGFGLLLGAGAALYDSPVEIPALLP